MPFINARISKKITDDEKKEIKTRLGQAIAIIPGKSESWLMVGLQDDQTLYFRGDDSVPMAFIEVSVYGGPDSGAFDRMTGELTAIFGDVLGIPADHMYVKYSTTTDWGWNGHNF